jgi:hypothetical protein
MVQIMTPHEMHALITKNLDGRRDLGVRKGILDLLLEPCNPFEPAKRRLPKKGVAFMACMALLMLLAFAAFNLWS